MSNRHHRNLLGLGVLLIATYASGATWTVEKDGSGDFTEIQDAIDEAADGDTIEIGPGRFDDFTYATPGGWSVARVEDKSLTFIGSGVDQTILGPENFGEPDDNFVYGIFVLAEGAVTRIRGLTCENIVDWGVRIESPGRCEIDECVFRQSGGGVYGLLGDGGWIRNCEFADNYTNFMHDTIVIGPPSIGVDIADCSFSNCFVGISAYWAGSHDITVRNCTFVGGLKGAGFTDGASGAILDCEFTGQSSYGIVCNNPGPVRIEGNVIDQTGMPNSACWTTFAGSPQYIVRNNVFSSDATIIRIISPWMDLVCEQNHFLRTGPEAWYIRPYEDDPLGGDPITLDFTNNFWGTDDSNEVAAWIYDGYDDPEHHFFIDFLPMSGGTVKTESRTWSDVKALFGAEGE